MKLRICAPYLQRTLLKTNRAFYDDTVADVRTFLRPGSTSNFQFADLSFCKPHGVEIFTTAGSWQKMNICIISSWSHVCSVFYTLLCKLQKTVYILESPTCTDFRPVWKVHRKKLQVFWILIFCWSVSLIEI